MEADGDFNMITEELENIATGKLWSRDTLMNIWLPSCVTFVKGILGKTRQKVCHVVTFSFFVALCSRNIPT